MDRSLSDYIVSTPRVLMVTTDEEERLVKKFNDLSPEGGKVRIFNQAFGLMDSTEYIDEWTELDGNQDTDTMALVQNVLPEIYRDPGVASEGGDGMLDPSYYIILDADDYLKNQMFRRWVKNIAIAGYEHPNVNRTVVLQSSDGVIPSELQGYVESHSMELPGPGLITDVAKNIEEEVRGYEIDHVIQQAKDEAEREGRRFDESDRLQIEDEYEFDFSIPSDREGDEIPREFLAACAGLTLFQIKELFIQLWVVENEIRTEDVFQYRQEIVSDDDIIEFVDNDVTFEDVAGLDRQKEWLEGVGACFTQEGREWGLKPPKGLLQVGVPGCGKSLTAKAVANEWGLPLIRFDPGKLFSSRVGSSERNMRRALEIIESCTPCVVWVDEIEKGFSGVESSNFSDGGTTARVIGTFLTWFEEHREEAFLVATSNDISQIPTEMVGRFDEVFFVYLPGPEARKECFRIHLENEWKPPMGDIKDIDLDRLSEATEMFTGREVVQVVKEGIRHGYRTPDQTVTTDCFLEVVEMKPPMVLTMSEDIRELYEWVGYDPERGEGIRARLASTERPEDPLEGDGPDVVEAEGEGGFSAIGVPADGTKVN